MFPKLVALLLAIVILVAAYARPSGGAGKPVTYVVQPTDTLWSIAVAHYGGDPRAAIWKLQTRNHVTATTLVPGQRLVLP